MYRQGELIFVRVSEVRGSQKDDLILAEGEIAGHKHEVTKGEAKLFEENGTLYLKVAEEGATITHPDHKKLELPKGDYEIQIQKEYQGIGEILRPVRD